MTPHVLLFLVAIFVGFENVCSSDDMELKHLAKRTKVDLIITPKTGVPPNSASGIIIPYGWDVTGESVNKCRAVIKALQERKYLQIRGPMESDKLKMLVKLRDEFPGLSVEQFPIVSIGIFWDGSEIREFVEGSHAKESGLRVGDKIFEAGGKPINAFDDLKSVLCEYTPGEQVEVKIFREKKRYVFSVKLSPYPTFKVVE